jgi:hypothetical protein
MSLVDFPRLRSKEIVTSLLIESGLNHHSMNYLLSPA